MLKPICLQRVMFAGVLTAMAAAGAACTPNQTLVLDEAGNLQGFDKFDFGAPVSLTREPVVDEPPSTLSMQISDSGLTAETSFLKGEPHGTWIIRDHDEVYRIEFHRGMVKSISHEPASVK